jgi:calcineurin-like phosphoesterase family protein
MLKATEKMLKEEGEENPEEFMKIVLESWKSIVDKSETPWALCDECYESIQIY